MHVILKRVVGLVCLLASLFVYKMLTLASLRLCIYVQSSSPTRWYSLTSTSTPAFLTRRSSSSYACIQAQRRALGK